MSPLEQPGAADSVGAALAAARVAAGRSTADVADHLRVREAVVLGIEDDDYTLCRGDVYARGHVRAYARLLGLDGAALLQAHAAAGPVQRPRRGRPAGPARPAASAGPARPAASARSARPAFSARSTGSARADGRRGVVHGPVPPLRPSPWRPVERRGVPWGLLTGVAVTGVLGFLGLQLVEALRAPARPAQEVAAPVRARPETTPAPASTASSRRAPSASTRPPAPRTRTAATATARPDPRAAIALRATGSSWVAVRGTSGRTKFTGVLGKGDSRRFTDVEGLRVTLGNAGGVQLTVNGRVVGPAGRDGEVKRLVIRPRDPA
jgi:cytoskeletal protein RodZ